MKTRINWSNAAGRLQQFREEAEQPNWVRPLTWRDTRRFHRNPITARSFPNGYSGDRTRLFLGSFDQIGTDLGCPHELGGWANRYPLGYYTSHLFQDETILGHIILVRTAKGTYYFPGTSGTGFDGVTVDLDTFEVVPKGSDQEAHDEAVRVVADWADSMADLEAEEAREYDLEYYAERKRDEIREEMRGYRAEFHALKREVPLVGGDAIRAAVRGHLERLVEDCHRCARSLNAIKSDPYTALVIDGV